VLVIVALSLTRVSQAQHACGNQVVSPTSGVTDGFGWSLDADSGLFVAAAVSVDGQYEDQGAVYVYGRTDGRWTLQATVESDDIVPFGYFGEYVALDHPWLFARQFTHAGGSTSLGGIPTLEVFRQTGGNWVFSQRLIPPSGLHQNAFGRGPKAAGGRLATTGWDDSNLLVIYELSLNSWVHRHSIDHSNLAPYSTNGVLVNEYDFDGDRIVLGHSGSNPAHVLDYNGQDWVAVAELTPPFQYSSPTVALAGGDVFVGDQHWNGMQGRVAVFREVAGIWALVQEITPSDPEFNSQFALFYEGSGDDMLIAAHLADTGGIQNSGASYWFHRENGVWIEQAKLLPDPPVQSEFAGRDNAIESGYAILGAPDGGLGLPGSTRIYPLSMELGVAYGETVLNSSGQPASLRARGSAWTEHDCLRFEARDLPPGQFGYLLMADTQAHGALPPPSQGLLHLGLPIVRFANDVLQADASGCAAFEPVLATLPQGTVIAPGETWSFQMWFRDSNPGSTSNTTNALALTFAASGDPRAQFPVSVLRRTEATTQFQVQVTLSHASSQVVQIPFTIGGTATDQVDWRVETSSPLIIAPGDTTAQLTITLADDLLQEADETATVTLQTPTNASLGTQPCFTLTIVDDD
jgi:hypothetical protein